jgi:hypothetical protein
LVLKGDSCAHLSIHSSNNFRNRWFNNPDL